MKIQEAIPLAEQLRELLSPGCLRIEIVGSTKRRDKPEVHDIEILCIADPKGPTPVFGSRVIHKTKLDAVIADLVDQNILGKPVLNGPALKKFAIIQLSEINPFFLELYIVHAHTWAIQNIIRTGPHEFSKRFVSNKRIGGLLPNCYEYVKGETIIKLEGKVLMLPEEKDAIELLGLGWIEPAKRINYA